MAGSDAGAFNKYPGVKIHELHVYVIITIIVLVLDKTDRIVDGHIDLTIESIEGDKIIADILTVLPEDFPLSTAIVQPDLNTLFSSIPGLIILNQPS